MMLPWYHFKMELGGGSSSAWHCGTHLVPGRVDGIGVSPLVGVAWMALWSDLVVTQDRGNTSPAPRQIDLVPTKFSATTLTITPPYQTW